MLRVIGWINRFLANIRKHQNDGEGGELTSKELRQAEEQITKTARQECFPEKLQALKYSKPLLSKGKALLKLTPKLYGGSTLDQTHYCDVQMICQKRRSFQSSFQRILSLQS